MLEEQIELERKLLKRTLEERYGKLAEEYLCHYCHQPEKLVRLTPSIGFYVHKCSWADEASPRLRGHYSFRRVAGFGSWNPEKGKWRMDVPEAEDA
jgi:hypothetical protein